MPPPPRLTSALQDRQWPKPSQAADVAFPARLGNGSVSVHAVHAARPVFDAAPFQLADPKRDSKRLKTYHVHAIGDTIDVARVPMYIRHAAAAYFSTRSSAVIASILRERRRRKQKIKPTNNRVDSGSTENFKRNESYYDISCSTNVLTRNDETRKYSWKLP